MVALEKPRFRVNQNNDVKPLNASASILYSGVNRQRDAARHDLSEFSGWNPGVRFAGNRSYEWSTITGRARDLDENNGWINGGLDRKVESVIGVNIRLSPQPRHNLLNRDYEWRMAWTADVQERYEVWGNDVEFRNDARQRLSFGAQAKLAYLTYLRDGEAAAEVRDNQRGLLNTTNVLLVEPERISMPQDRALMETPTLRGGIAYNDNGAAIGYYIRSSHPGDPVSGFKGARWDYVPRFGPTGRAKFVHIFSPRRAEQDRGISRLAEIMVPAKMADRVDRAEVHAALKAALLSMFIKSPGTTEDLEGALAPTSDSSTVDPWIDSYLKYRHDDPVMVDGANIVHLLPGEDVEFPDAAHPNSNYPSFIKFILQKIAASMGISYPQLSQDWSGINYSSARALLNEIWRSFLEDRRYFCQHFLTPIYAAWLEMEVAVGSVKIPGGPANFYRNKTAICMAEWIGPGRGSVDPLKEANANNLDTAAGRGSTVEYIIERGRDPRDVMAEEAWFRKEREKMGLPELNHNVKDAGAAADAAAANDETAAEDAANAQNDKRAAA